MRERAGADVTARFARPPARRAEPTNSASASRSLPAFAVDRSIS
jgi:hypothetical protein